MGCRAKWFPCLSKEERQAPLAAGGLLMGTGGRQFLTIPGQVWAATLWTASLSGFRIDGWWSWPCRIPAWWGRGASTSSEGRHHGFTISLL